MLNVLIFIGIVKKVMRITSHNICCMVLLLLEAGKICSFMQPNVATLKLGATVIFQKAINFA